jgi:hypothetical protein
MCELLHTSPVVQKRMVTRDGGHSYRGQSVAPCLRGSCGIIKRRSCSCRSGQVLRQGGLPAPCKDSAICAFRLVIFITSRDPNWVAAVAPWVTTHWRANFSGANRWGANLGESQVLKANSGLFVLAVSFVVSGLP